jgi:TRAP-type transport system small permease protein
MAKLIKQATDALFKAFEVVMVLCISVMLVMVFGNVMLRLFFNTGIDLSEEIPRFAFVWMTFIGAMVGMKKRAHLGVDMFTQLLPVLGRKICWGISQAIMAVCCVYMVYGTYLQHDIIAGSASPVAQLSMVWVFGISYLTGTVIGIICLSNLFRLFTGQVPDNELVDVMEEGISEAHEIEKEMLEQEKSAIAGVKHAQTAPISGAKL